MNIVDFITTVYVMTDDYLQEMFPPRRLRSRGFLPKLSDSEVITMELVGEYLGYQNDSDIYRYFSRHWRGLFPDLPDRSNFVRQAANLWKIKEQLCSQLISLTRSFVHILDSVPIEVRKFIRANHGQLFKGSARYGKWWGQTYFGYRLHLKIDGSGMIRKWAIAPANVNDVTIAPELIAADSGLVLGDRGYRSESLQKKLWDRQRLHLFTAPRKKADKQDEAGKLIGVRRLIETVVGQFEEQFRIKTTTARDLWHLMNRITRKVLTHTLCVHINRMLGRAPLHIKGLVC